MVVIGVVSAAGAVVPGRYAALTCAP